MNKTYVQYLRYCFLGFSLKILLCNYLKNTLPSMKKKPYDRILREEPKEQHLSNVPKSRSLSLSLYTHTHTFLTCSFPKIAHEPNFLITPCICMSTIKNNNNYIVQIIYIF